MNKVYISARRYTVLDVVCWIVIAGFAGAWIGAQVIAYVVGK